MVLTRMNSCASRPRAAPQWHGYLFPVVSPLRVSTISWTIRAQRGDSTYRFGRRGLARELYEKQRGISHGGAPTITRAALVARQGKTSAHPARLRCYLRHHRAVDPRRGHHHFAAHHFVTAKQCFPPGRTSGRARCVEHGTRPDHSTAVHQGYRGYRTSYTCAP